MKLIETIVLLALYAVLEIAADHVAVTEACVETERVAELTEDLSERIMQTESSWEIISTENTEYLEESEPKEETERLTETESLTETECITETESGTEKSSEDIRIVVSNIRITQEQGEKIYDGTDIVNVDAELEGLPDGVVCSIEGRAESCDVGTWPVEIRVFPQIEESENITVVIEEQMPLMVTIVPKPLKLEISDARKSYFSDNRMEHVVFQEEEEIKVSGFLEDEWHEPMIPEGFEKPQLQIDEDILQKESPMYSSNGEEIVYQGAITVKKDGFGKITGNPTQNYCFCDEETWLKKGNVVLSPTPVIGTLDYSIRCTDMSHSWQDADGTFWIRKGETILIEPCKNRGFTHGKTIRNVQKSNIEEFFLTRRSADGLILADSQIRSLEWKVDDQSPEGKLTVTGNSITREKTDYYTDAVTVRIEEAKDQQSGLRVKQMMILRGESSENEPEQWYQSSANEWTEQSEVTLTEEGEYRVIARLEDHVGNETYIHTRRMVIDRSEPKITVEGIVPGSANKGSVMITVRCSDAYIAEEDIKIKVCGFENGEKDVNWQMERTENVLIMRGMNFPMEKAWDDIYELSINVMDYAGNCAEETMRFSVNRFGSVFYIDRETQSKLQQFYLQKPVPITIREVNVDYLTKSRITVGYEGHVRILEKGKDYTVTKRGTDTTWKEYCYTIPASVFSKEGFYYIECFSTDRAQNTADNRTQKKKLNFAVDKTPPEIIVTGLEADKIYEGESRQIYVECMDNVMLDYLDLYVDGKRVAHGSSGEQRLVLNSSDEWQTFQAAARDKAGNCRMGDVIYYWLGNKQRVKQLKKTEIIQDTSNEIRQTEIPEETPENQKVELDKNQTGTEDNKENSSVIYPYCMAGIAIFTVFAAILYGAKRLKE